jgi:hypothetical protein
MILTGWRRSRYQLSHFWLLLLIDTAWNIAKAMNSDGGYEIKLVDEMMA